MSLKTEIEKKLGLPVAVKAGMPGSMDIFVDRERIFSKAQTGVMPRIPDILSAIEGRMAK